MFDSEFTNAMYAAVIIGTPLQENTCLTKKFNEEKQSS